MKEESTLQTIIGVVVILGVLFVVSRFFNKTYTPLEKGTAAPQMTLPAGMSQLPLTCAILVSDTMLKSGNEIPGLNVGAAPSALSLVRPVGEMLSGFLVAAAHNCFRDVRLVSTDTDAQGSDIIIKLVNWQFGMNDNDTGYNFTGLPLLFASGKAFTTLNVEVYVSGQNIPAFMVRESAKGTRELSVAIFPVSRLSRSMTESSDLAAASVSQKVFDKIMQNPNISGLAEKKSQ